MEPSPPPTRYKRKYADAKAVASEDLRAAYETAAQLVAEQGDKYLPLFERLDAELQNRGEREQTRSRAIEVAKVARPPRPASS
jgi:hypothetical protein